VPPFVPGGTPVGRDKDPGGGGSDDFVGIGGVDFKAVGMEGGGLKQGAPGGSAVGGFMDLVTCGDVDRVVVEGVDGHGRHPAPEGIGESELVPGEPLVGAFRDESCFGAAVEDGRVGGGHVEAVDVDLPGTGARLVGIGGIVEEVGLFGSQEGPAFSVGVVYTG